MLFLITVTFPAQNKNAALKRTAEMGLKPPSGMKFINMWSAVKGHKATILAEIEDPAAMMKFADSIDDLVDIEVELVIPSEEAVKINQAQSKKK